MRRDVQEIFRNTPHTKQVMMFSATLSKEIRPVCRKFMNDVISLFFKIRLLECLRVLCIDIENFPCYKIINVFHHPSIIFLITSRFLWFHVISYTLLELMKILIQFSKVFCSQQTRRNVRKLNLI